MAISIADSSCSSPRSSLGFLLDPEKVEPPRPKQSMWHRLGLRRWLGRDDRDFFSRSPTSTDSPPASNTRPNSKGTDSPPPKSHDNLTRRLSRKVGVGLPRSTTFKRQHSESRDRLSPVNSEPRRAASADRRTLSLERTKSPQSVVDPRLSAPEINWREDPDPEPSPTKVDDPPETNEDTTQDSDVRSEWDHYPEVTDTPEGYPVDNFDMDLERRWILNLSMHFRDGSEREKFFVTYAEAANRWRRVTISCDYRDAEPESLEQDLKELRYQRDKCARIYESIRESLTEIQFYDTVTNLKLETLDGRLHVHVTEDVNEIIPYPPISSIGHLPDAQLVPERRLHFEAHLSGFVYNVRLGDRSFIKKEIPGPDTVDEFLYEINALHALQSTPNVIQVEGIVVDDRQEVVKGLLISFAEKGALVDILYEYRGTISWERRERWARQIVHGLCEIHESGYVQGDFTLSNIVVDANDDAKIIDINRRGCPVGWEPPEIVAKIESNQRISMYIGVKTDLFQLGMTLWALAMEEDEPERQRRPFVLDEDLPVPDYYRRVVSICLSPIPRHRLSAKELLNFFPPETGTFEQLPRMQPPISVGVGLHNGVFPLYDSRASFLYPRGRQMGSFGHSRPHTAHHSPHDDPESIPSPETDGAFVYKEEQDRQLEPYDTVPRPNGIRKETSIILDERNSVDDLIPVTEYTERNLSLDYGDSEIDLDGGVDPRYRISSTDMTMVDPVSDAEHLPNELGSAGPWEHSSRNGSIHCQRPESLPATQAPVNIYPAGSAAEDWTSQEPLQSESTLLQSALPINPAAEFELGPSATKDNSPPPSDISDYPQHLNDQQSSYLSESTLPINPALISLEEPPKQNIPSQPSPSIQSDFVCSQASLQGPYLSESVLPINPAVRSPEVDRSSSGADSLLPRLVETIPENHQHTIHDQHFCLSESILPINPAIETPEDVFDHQKHTISAPDLKAAQDSQNIDQDQDQNSFSNSKLPINPAMTSSQVSNHKTDDTTGFNAISISRAPKHIETSNQDFSLRDSHLPINPAAKASTETINQDSAPTSTIGHKSTLYPQHVVHDLNSYLNDSHLPINPAFTGKAVQFV
ncbi:hypothetical protein ASPVEDRAFT_83013 [Aspergillus versicolor CBS 583.65]|uniref:Protein kinase domain-containing protein n=1 Tax=Aspergillus versicolor CBS 583.65 TaxID=1036611 RepID=A0A1L9PIY4_ASPVE|nr:uncharacterized protein ASPVEDRAFT_83013 [Aspergillus versicolor CBS 583.65]OJJ01487.1 hypothetical protein ASPVEDRAFT_83013 [Aspergillus versicolor CBS 583.65]